MADGSKSKAGRNHETTDESTIESEVAKPWAMRGVEVKWRTRGPRAIAQLVEHWIVIYTNYYNYSRSC